MAVAAVGGPSLAVAVLSASILSRLGPIEVREPNKTSLLIMSRTDRLHRRRACGTTLELLIGKDLRRFGGRLMARGKKARRPSRISPRSSGDRATVS